MGSDQGYCQMSYNAVPTTKKYLAQISRVLKLRYPVLWRKKQQYHIYLISGSDNNQRSAVIKAIIQKTKDGYFQICHDYKGRKQVDDKKYFIFLDFHHLASFFVLKHSPFTFFAIFPTSFPRLFPSSPTTIL